jgi:hypothetical protein
MALRNVFLFTVLIHSFQSYSGARATLPCSYSKQPFSPYNMKSDSAKQRVESMTLSLHSEQTGDSIRKRIPDALSIGRLFAVPLFMAFFINGQVPKFK